MEIFTLLISKFVSQLYFLSYVNRYNGGMPNCVCQATSRIYDARKCSFHIRWYCTIHPIGLRTIIPSSSQQSSKSWFADRLVPRAVLGAMLLFWWLVVVRRWDYKDAVTVWEVWHLWVISSNFVLWLMSFRISDHRYAYGMTVHTYITIRFTLLVHDHHYSIFVGCNAQNMVHDT